MTKKDHFYIGLWLLTLAGIADCATGVLGMCPLYCIKISGLGIGNKNV